LGVAIASLAGVVSAIAQTVVAIAIAVAIPTIGVGRARTVVRGLQIFWAAAVYLVVPFAELRRRRTH
jgi:hypothetical protein